MEYRGLKIPIPFGKTGFSDSSDVDAMPPTALKVAKNVRYDEDVVRKVGGLTAFDANTVTSTPICVAGIDWWPDTSTQRQVTVWSSGKVYKEVGADMDSVELATGYTFSNPVMLVPCGQELPGNSRKLILFSKGIAPIALTADGSSMSALANVSPNWTSTNQPAGGLMHDNRVVTWGNPGAPHDIEFSALDDHTNFKSTNPSVTGAFPLPAFSIMPGEAEYVNACYSIGTTRLYIFKHPYGIYFIDTDNMTSFVAPVTTVRKDIGIAGPKAITKVGALGTWFIGADGHVYSLDMLNDPNADIRDTCITKAKQLKNWIKTNVLSSRLPHAQLLYDSNRGEVIATYTSQTNTTNSLCLIFDVNNPKNIKVSIDDRGTYFNAMWFYKESSSYQQLLTAGTGGYVYKMHQNNRKIGSSTGYEGRASTSMNDLGWFNEDLASRNKRFDWLEIRSLTTSGTADVNVDVYIDGSYYNTYSYNSQSSGSPLDDPGYDLTPNTGAADFTLADDGYARKFIKIGGIGRRIQLSFYNSSSNSDFGIGKLVLYCEPLLTGAEV